VVGVGNVGGGGEPEDLNHLGFDAQEVVASKFMWSALWMRNLLWEEAQHSRNSKFKIFRG
jgi:hypothetical protein